MVSCHCVISMFFFYETIMVVYQLIVQDFIASPEIDGRDAWFQEDCVPAHTAGSTLHMLQEFFGVRDIAKGLCPPQSCDLTSNFVLWSMVKDCVFSRNPTSLADLDGLNHGINWNNQPEDA